MNAVTYADDSPNIIVSGSDDALIKVRPQLQDCLLSVGITESFTDDAAAAADVCLSVPKVSALGNMILM